MQAAAAELGRRLDAAYQTFHELYHQATEILTIGQRKTVLAGH